MGKIADENVVIFIIKKLAPQKAAIIMLTTMLLACHVDVVGNQSLHTSVPISHFETFLLFFYFIFLYSLRDEQNCDISNILQYFRLRAVFQISVSDERSRKW